MKNILVLFSFVLCPILIFSQEFLVKPGTKITVTTGITIDVAGGNLLLQSDGTGDASFLQRGNITFSGGGEAKVERFISGWTDNLHGWHLLSSPVAAQNIQSEFVSNPPSSGQDFFKWDEVSSLWINTKLENGLWNTEFENTFGVGSGYLCGYNSDLTKTFAGTLNADDVDVSGLTYTATSNAPGWHLIGNPYPCALQWNNSAGWNLNNIDGVIKVWNESTASYTDISTGVIIPAHQGFMIHVTDAGTGSLTIPVADRTHSPVAWFKDEMFNAIRLTAFDPEGSTSQQCVVKFADDATHAFDSKYDSHFLTGYAPKFFSVSDGDSLSINTLPEISAEMEIPVHFLKNASSDFYIKAEGVNDLIPQRDVYLSDLKLDITQKLNDDPEYHFTSFDEDVQARFKLHFDLLTVNDPALNVKIFSANGNIYLRFPEPTTATISVYNITGQLCRTVNTGNSNTATINLSNASGAYVVTIVTPQYFLSEKVILN